MNHEGDGREGEPGPFLSVVSSQYWNHVYRADLEDVRQVGEGLRIMRSLGENMAWLLRCIEAGRKAEVPEPHYEDWIRTNFVR